MGRHVPQQLSAPPGASRWWVALILFAALLGGCLTWSSPDDDDSGAVDDDDIVADDDDSGAVDDDDATTPEPELPVDPATDGALILIRFDGVNSGLLLLSAFADEPIAPSAEEAAVTLGTEVSVATYAPTDGFRDTDVDTYPGPFSLETEDIIAVVGAESFPLSEAAPGLWVAQELGPGQIEAGGAWTAEFTGTGPFSGVHDAPPLPELPQLASDRLLGSTLFVRDGSGIELETLLPPAVEPDVFAIIGFGAEASRGWATTSGQLSIPPGQVPELGSDPIFFYQRTARLREDGEGGSLLLSSGAWVLGALQPLAAGDVFLRPVDPEPGAVQPGQLLEFVPEPALANPSLPYVVRINGTEFGGVVQGGVLSVTIDNPGALGSGWVSVEMEIPGGIGRSSIRVGGPPPGCDLEESGSNDIVDGANSFLAGQTLCGSFEVPGDIDFSMFEATLGATYEIEAFSQRLGAPADTILAVVDDSGTELLVNDDFFGVDSKLRWTAQASGPVRLRLTEYNSAGGPEYEWRLQVRPAAGP